VTAAPREILKRALALNAAGLVVAHNHPSGLPKPSAADHTFTQQLVQAATAVGLQLHDHIIIGTEGHYSFKGAGEL
jgi:DNA repair protein RadC